MMSAKHDQLGKWQYKKHGLASKKFPSVSKPQQAMFSLDVRVQEPHLLSLFAEF